MENNKISIIMPVYNVAKYLPECLDSILSQTYKNFELICINDGSTDNSLEILEKYQANDGRIIIINQENKGVSIARNKGLEIAKGEYILFCDSDDYYSSDLAFEKAIVAIKKENSDICVFSYEMLSNGEYAQNFNSRKIKQMLTGTMEFNPALFIYLWQKIYRSDFLRKNKIKFVENQHTAEDVIFMYMTIFYGAKVSLLDEVLYIYRMNRENSLTTLNINGIKSDLQALKTLYATDIHKKQSQDIKKQVVKQFMGGCFYYYEKFNSYFQHICLRKDMKKMISFLEKNHEKSFLYSLSEFCRLKKLVQNIPLQIVGEILGKKNFSKDLKSYCAEINLRRNLIKINKELTGKKVLIYGAGIFFEYIKNNFDLSELNVIGISDMKFSEAQAGEEFLGYKIVPRTELFNQEADYILLAIQNYESILFNLNLENTSKSTKILPLAKKPWFSIFMQEY